MDILCFSSTDWDDIWGSRQQIMGRLARRGHRVLYVERPLGWEHFLRYPDMRRNRQRRWREGVRQTQENLWIAPLPLLLPGRYVSPAINHFNQRGVIAAIRPLAMKLGFTAPLLWLYKPEMGPLIGHFRERLSIYHCIDEFSAGTQGRKRRLIQAMEAQLIQAVDLVLANSSLTYANKRRLKPDTYQVRSAADVEHFAQALQESLPAHPELEGLPHPIAGFIGNLDERIDTLLLAQVAQRLSGWHFVIVGEAYPQKVDLADLRALPNVHFLGRKPYGELPALIKGMQVLLAPYVADERARYRSPIKLYEALASGHPLVSTPQPEIEEFGAVVRIAAHAEDMAAQIEAALQDSPAARAARLELARRNSWEQRVDEIEAILRQFLTKEHRSGG